MTRFVGFVDHYGRPAFVDHDKVASIKAGQRGGSWINMTEGARSVFVMNDPQQVAEVLNRSVSP